MTIFKYEVSDSGMRKKGTVEAQNHDDAVSILRGQSYVILSLGVVSSAGSRQQGESHLLPLSIKNFFTKFLVKSRGKEVAFRQLASLLDAGVPIVSALEIAGQTGSFALKKSFHRIVRDIGEGVSVPNAFQKRAVWLNDVTQGLVEIGDANGQLPDMLRYSADWMKRMRTLVWRLVEALAYPFVVVLMALFVGYFLVNVFIPKLLEFISSNTSSATLPVSTQLLMDITYFLQEYTLGIFIGFLVTFVLIILGRQNDKFGQMVDYIILKIPVIGPCLIATVNALWTRTLGVLLRSGMNIVSALEMVKKNTTNLHVKKQLEIASDMICEGHAVSEALEHTTLSKLNPMAFAMVKVGERSGTMDDSLTQSADYAEEDLVHRIEILSKLIEPVIYIAVGLMVGFVYFAFFEATSAVIKSIG